ncbi:hypothetical protein RND81_14G022300 [Saponaria officinalis]|uniref:Ribosomal protein S7 n=1 Tax=Saponaria officinalis TaxID=3572 RepID=A0AAW1GTB9_SAPOF
MLREDRETMGRRILNDALRTIVNAKKRNTASAELKPISTVICFFLNTMKKRVLSNVGWNRRSLSKLFSQLMLISLTLRSTAV